MRVLSLPFYIEVLEARSRHLRSPFHHEQVSFR